MASPVFIVCDQGGVVFDIEGGAKNPNDGTSLDAYSQKGSDDKSPSGNKNQLWTIEAIPFESGGPDIWDGYYYIQSVLKDRDGNDLVVSVKDESFNPGAEVQVGTEPQNQNVSDGQAWYFTPGPAGWFYIGSYTAVANGAPAVVVGIEGGSQNIGTALKTQSVQTKESPGGNDYQLWKFVNEKGETIAPPKPPPTWGGNWPGGPGPGPKPM